MATLKSLAAVPFGLLLVMGTVVNAQNLLTKEELAAIEQADLANQAKLPHYTWQEIQFISVNGESGRLQGIFGNDRDDGQTSQGFDNGTYRSESKPLNRRQRSSFHLTAHTRSSFANWPAIHLVKGRPTHSGQQSR